MFILLLKYAVNINTPLFMDTGFGNKRRLIDISSAADSIGTDMCNALPSFHAFTGCDTISAFVRKGKLGHFRVLQKNPRYVSVFENLGSNARVSPKQLSDLEAFSCLLYSGRSPSKDINRLRYTMFMTRFTSKKELLSSETGIDLSLLPPCRSSLIMHIKRTNYQALIWKQAHLAYPELPKPHNGHGWLLLGDDLEYKWASSEMLPQELADFVQDLEDLEKDDSSIVEDIFEGDEEEEEDEE